MATFLEFTEPPKQFLDFFMALDGRRALCSGKEFSEFDLITFNIAAGPPVQSPAYFSVADCLAERLAVQELTGILDEPADIMLPPTPYSSFPPSHASSPPVPLPLDDSPSLPLSHDLSALDKKKLGSKRKRKQKCTAEAEVSEDPQLKQVHQHRRDAAKKNLLQVNTDTANLAHSKPAWISN
ncbi:hypothetical protein DFH09DRAFT_1307909 [Mycena vulgaris]|nr:hypothetical protein DFH09DRAFT_1307909 [Mycena vulgaris]